MSSNTVPYGIEDFGRDDGSTCEVLDSDGRRMIYFDIDHTGAWRGFQTVNRELYLVCDGRMVPGMEGVFSLVENCFIRYSDRLARLSHRDPLTGAERFFYFMNLNVVADISQYLGGTGKLDVWAEKIAGCFGKNLKPAEMTRPLTTRNMQELRSMMEKIVARQRRGEEAKCNM